MDFISKLPNELLIKIFEDCKVLRLTHVSRKFNDVISNSPLLMRKVQLLITEKSNPAEIIKSNRKYQNVLIKFNYKVGKAALEIIKRFRNEIKHLEMMRCIVHEDVFHDILMSIPNLENLSIFTTFMKSDFKQEFEMPELRKLKKLTFRNSHLDFLNFFENSRNLKCINVGFSHHQPVDIMINFLQKHPEIESIENIMVEKIDENLVTEIINLKSLKKLSIEIDRIDVEAMRNLELSNYTVEFLNLYGNVDNPEDFNTILKIFKGLKSLEIEMNSSLEPINIAQLNCKKILSLNFNQCQGNFFNEIQITSLKTFKMNEALSITQEDWINFAHRNPNVENLKIKDESISNDTFISITQEFRNLIQFELSFDPQRLTTRILDFICDNLPFNIKILKISERISSNQRHFILSPEQKEKLMHRNGFNLILS